MNDSRTTGDSAWLETITGPTPDCPTLYLFPHAGAGAAAYLGWSRPLASSCSVLTLRYPGRERMVRLPCWTSVSEATRALTDKLRPAAPYVLYGHSLGALIAFEVARELRRRGQPAPALLIVSGARSPEYAASIPSICDLSTEQFVAAVGERYGLLPPELLRDPAAVAYYSDLLRADIRLVERYQYVEAPVLDCDIEVLCGRSDPLVNRAMAEAWSAHGRDVRLHWYEGDHFFIHQARDLVHEDIRRAIASRLRPANPASGTLREEVA